MSRPLRIQYPGAYYHVMNRGQGRQAVFRQDAHYQLFLDVIGEAAKMFNVKVYAFSLMVNHYHLLIQTPEGNLSRFMRHLNGVYTQRFNRLQNRDGSVFRGRYKAIVVDKDSYFLELIRYIHLNPVRAKMVPQPQDHRWSSHGMYIGKRKKATWLEDEGLRTFGHRKQAARRDFHRFVKNGVDSDLESQLKARKWPSALGTNSFVEKIKKMVQVDYEIPASKAETKRGTAKKWIEAVSLAYGISIDDLSQRRRGPSSAPRAMAAYMARQESGASLQEISEVIGGVTARGVSHLVKRGTDLAASAEGKKILRQALDCYGET